VDGATAVQAMAEVIDAHDWDGLAALLHPELTVDFVHTGERLDRDGWVRLNADYPGFDRFAVRDLVADGDRAVARAHVTSITDGVTNHFEVATFVTVRDGLVARIVEVWTDVDQSVPEGTRPD